MFQNSSEFCVNNDLENKHVFCKHAMIIMSKCDLCAIVKLIIGVSEYGIKIQHIWV